jgi:broad specificity phosphatase PhoE
MTLSELWLVRHGESVANVAAARAEASGAEVIEVGWRDADVPLSDTGREQALALGGLLARLPEPAAVWTSPYLRARQTIEIAFPGGAGSPGSAGGPVARLDERLRDRELGILDLLTAHGVEQRFPAEAARRRWLGKLYYRPPGGESWSDVAARLRSFLRDADAAVDGVALVSSHDAVVWLFLFVCLGLDEAALFELVAGRSIANASFTRLRRVGAAWRLEEFAETGHLAQQGAPVTHHPGERSDVH